MKFNSIKFTVLNVRTKTIILPKENMRETISAFELGKDFLHRTLKTQITEEE